jgi:KEOPS complex subunit Cgi121
VRAYVKEFRKSCEIVGFRDVEVNDIEALLKAARRDKPSDVELQFFDADLVATWQHLYFALLNALTAFKNGENLSKSVVMEAMLYAAGRRQIQKATRLLGIKPASRTIAILIVGGNAKVVQEALAKVSRRVGGQRADSVLELSGEKIERIKRAFDILDVELATVMEGEDLEKALVDLVVERVALLATRR